jgi:hypothetical protein
MRLAKRCLSSGLLLAFAARAAEPPPPPAEPGPWTLRVHILTSDERVELRRLADDALICKTPCGVELQLHEADAFVLTGSGVSASKPFEFSPRDGDVKLRVTTGSVVPTVVGAGLLVAGAITATYAGLLALDASVSPGFCNTPDCRASADSKSTTAGTVALIGLGALIVGGFCLAYGVAGRTTYKVED